MTTTAATPETDLSPAAAAPPLRMAYLLSRYPAVSHTFLLNEILSLRHLGVEIEVASINPPEPAFEKLCAVEAAESKLTFYIKDIGHVAGVMVTLKTIVLRPSVFFRGLKAALQLNPWNLYETVYALFYLVEAIVVGDWMVRRGHTHLHIHFSGAVATVGMLASIAWQIPYSLTVHGPDEFFDVRHFYLRKKIEQAEVIFCISNFCRSQLARLTSPQHWNKMQVVRLGIDPEVFKRRFNPREGHDKKVELVCVGRLVPAKGQLVLLRAFLDLLRKGHAIRLRLIGDGPDRPNVEAFIREHGISEHVTLEGSLSHERTRELLGLADIFVLASFAEGVPVALMEAMAMEIPCVSTFVAGIPELIRDGRDGLLVAASSTEELSAALERLIVDAAMRARLGASGRDRVLDLYTLPLNAQTLADAMQQHFLRSQRGIRP